MTDVGRDIVSRVGIYVRESRDDNEENYGTIETQRDLLTDFVKKNALGEIINVYIDDNVSGSGFERKGIELLKKDISENKLNLLIVKDLSRLGRNNAKTLLFLDFLEEHGVRVITFDGRYDSLKDNDTVGIDTWFNERYIRDISRKIRTNIRFKIEKGEYLGHAPYGYVKSTDQKNKLIRDDATADIVSEIYDLYRKGYGYLYIAKYLNMKMYPPPSARSSNGNKTELWNAVTVQRILTNRVYLGETIQGISERVSFKSRKIRKLPSSSWVVTKNTHESIISTPDFEEVQDIRLKKSINTGQHKGKIHLLKGILFCGKCNSIMFSRYRKNRPMGYICGNYSKHGKAKCSSHYVSEAFIADILNREMMSLFDSKSDLKGMFEKLSKDSMKKVSIGSEVLRLEQVLSSKQKQQDTLYMDKLDGKISEQLFIRINQSIESRISMIRHEIEKLKIKKSDEKLEEDIVDSAYAEIFKHGINYEIIRFMVEKIVVFDKNDSFEKVHKTLDDETIKNENGALIIEFKYS